MSQSSSPMDSTTSSRLGAWLHIWGPALWAGAVLLAAIYFYQLADGIKYSSRPGRLGPAFWPKAILIMLLATAALDLFFEARKAISRSRSGRAVGSVENGSKRVWWLMALGLVVTLAYVNFSTFIGFPLANFAFLLAFMLIGGYRKPIPVVLIAAIGTVVLILLFVRVVYVSLPLGAGPFQDLTLWLYSLLGIV